ncbi:MAG: Glycosyl transferase family 2 [Candidatus Moranbacteria bacterium GW2011_GWF1_44_4]|nr:MAG: Glycosyl transferase family 2 [Candidatus Moranbacteria bacterium GW2011_GWF1_44_4]
MNIRYIKARIKRFLKKYRGLSRLLWDEFKFGGFSDTVFAVRRHFKKRKGEWKGGYPAADDFQKNLVTIAILSKDHLELLKTCLESVEANLSQKYDVEILVGDTGSRQWKVWKFYREARKKWKNVKVVKFRRYFFSKNYNQLIENHAKGEYLILLNNDTIVKGNWIDELVDPLRNKQIGAVGGKLLYKDETIQHAGMEFQDSNAIAVFAKEKKDFPKVNFDAFVPVVTFACVATRHDVFDRFKLSENFLEECQDTDFCLRLQESGFKVLYNPECEIYHLESSSRDFRKGEADRQLLKKRWGKRINEIITAGNQRVKFEPEEYKNSVTIVRDDGIGDLLMGVSAFKNFRETRLRQGPPATMLQLRAGFGGQEYPERKLILATYERNIEMMAGFGIFDEFIPIPNGKKYSPLPIPTGEGGKIYNFIDLEMSFGPIWGNVKNDNKINRHFVYSRRMGLDENFKLVSMPDYPEARKRVEKLITKIGVDISAKGGSASGGNQKFVVFNLGASNPARSWWGPYYPKLIEAVEKMGFTPLILGTKDSEYYKGEKVVNLVGKTKTITEFIEALKLGKYVISADTSATHIAALAGIPFLAIFTGGMTPESRLNLYEKYEVLAPPKSLKCYPCWDEGCKDLSVRWKNDPCRLLIKPEEVIDKFKKLVEKYPR